MNRKILVDPKSLELAKHFLFGESATDSEAISLAAEIQQSVEDWFAHRDMLREAANRFHDRVALLSSQADTTDFAIMRWAQRNPRVCCSNEPTGEPILFGGRREP